MSDRETISQSRHHPKQTQGNSSRQERAFLAAPRQWTEPAREWLRFRLLSVQIRAWPVTIARRLI